MARRYIRTALLPGIVASAVVSPLGQPELDPEIRQISSSGALILCTQLLKAHFGHCRVTMQYDEGAVVNPWRASAWAWADTINNHTFREQKAATPVSAAMGLLVHLFRPGFDETDQVHIPPMLPEGARPEWLR